MEISASEFEIDLPNEIVSITIGDNVFKMREVSRVYDMVRVRNSKNRDQFVDLE